jgi:plastocyanin
MRRLILWVLVLPLAGVSPQSTTIIQKHRAFTIESITIGRGQTLVFSNEDGFSHQVYVETPQFTFESDEQEPGTTVPVTFPVSGHFVVHCHIHPKMHLDVDVQ